ncbi:MAG: ABC transporter permease, partial [Planctomycetota bacterium]
MPYLAIIYDSFRAAFANRILWIAFLAVYVTLAVIAPLSTKEVYVTDFRPTDFADGTNFKLTLAKTIRDPQSNPRVAGMLPMLPEKLRNQLEEVADDPEKTIRLDLLTDGVNALLEDESWYDEEQWSSLRSFKELRDLNDTPDDQLSEDLRTRRARLRVEQAFPGVFPARRGRVIALYYAGFEWFETMMEGPQFEAVVNGAILPSVLSWVFGFVAIFVGILVTAGIIPEMMRDGALHLLLSKPVSRVGLLMTKFVGGCAFVFLCFSQLVIGLYLILGIRLGMWNHRLLWCIPAFLFLFAIYYSVSVLVGLKFRQPIVCIGVTLVFWVLCSCIGWVDSIFENIIVESSRVHAIAKTDSEVLGVTRQIVPTRKERLVRLNRDTNEWEEVYGGSGGFGPVRKLLPPVVIDNDKIVTAELTLAMTRLNRLETVTSSRFPLMIAGAETKWRCVPTFKLPGATEALTRSGDDLFAVTSKGVYRLPIQSLL